MQQNTDNLFQYKTSQLLVADRKRYLLSDNGQERPSLLQMRNRQLRD